MKRMLIAGIAIMICLAIVLTACLLWVGSLSKRLTELEQDHWKLFDEVSDLYGELYGLQAELEEIDRKANSLLEEMEYTITGAGTQPHTVAYQLTLVPKEIAQDTAVELTVGSTTVPFTREGNAFTGTVDIPLFEENENYPVLTVTSAGITKTDELEDINLWHTYSDWLPELFQSMSGSESSDGDGSTNVFFSYGFRPKDWYTGDPVTFTKITMIRTVNGDEVLCEDVTDRQRDDANQGFTEVHTEFLVNREDQVTVLVRAEDSQGYIHELETRCQYDRENDSISYESGLEQIYAPDGTALIADPFDDIG